MLKNAQQEKSIVWGRLFVGTALVLFGVCAQAQDIRLMPLGASITDGGNSSSGTGYRNALHKLLDAKADSVDFVGSKHSGKMTDADHEGHSGFRIDQVAGLSTGALKKYRPNVVTLLVGTNDMVQNHQADKAHERLGALIDQILAAAPDATVLVADIVPSAKPEVQARTAAYNAKIPGVVQVRANAGKHVAYVSVDSVTVDDLVADGIHPTDAGYEKIAKAWNAAVQRAVSLDWIKEPVPVAVLPSDGPHTLHPKVATNMALDDLSGNTKAGNPVVIWTTNGTGAQSWNFESDGVKQDGFYNIAVSYGPYCLTASGAKSGSVVNLQSCNGSASQAWEAVPAASGYAFKPATNSALCLDVKSSHTTPGTLVQVWTCNNTTAQQWSLK